MTVTDSTPTRIELTNPNPTSGLFAALVAEKLPTPAPAPKPAKPAPKPFKSKGIGTAVPPKAPRGAKGMLPSAERIAANQELAEEAGELLALAVETGAHFPSWIEEVLQEENILTIRGAESAKTIKKALVLLRQNLAAESDRQTTVVMAESAIESFGAGFRKVIHGWVRTELETIEFLDRDELHLRVREAGARKSTALAVKIFFVQMAKEVCDTDPEWAAEFEQGAEDLQAVMDHCTLIIASRRAAREGGKAEGEASTAKPTADTVPAPSRPAKTDEERAEARTEQERKRAEKRARDRAERQERKTPKGQG